MCEAGIGGSSRSRLLPFPGFQTGTLQESWRAAVDGGTYGTAQRIERLMAEMMAFSELVIIEESMPTPQITVVSASSPISHST